ncbi:MAG: hypothetical protein H8E25_12905 [Planctomycetes bacterium]|nr:hypothetical protein [Planctomycetota bacterium]
MSIPLTGIYFEYRKKQDRNALLTEAVKSGADVEALRQLLEPDASENTQKTRHPYRPGLICLGLGLAMIILAVTSVATQVEELFIPGTILSGLGVAFIIADYINRKRFSDD